MNAKLYFLVLAILCFVSVAFSSQVCFGSTSNLNRDRGQKTETFLCTKPVAKGGLAGNVTQSTTGTTSNCCNFNTDGTFSYTKKKRCTATLPQPIVNFCRMTVQAGSGVAGVLSCNNVARSNSSRITCGTRKTAAGLASGSNVATFTGVKSVSTVSVATPSSNSVASVSSPTVSSISNASVSSVTVSSLSNASVSSVTVSSISNASVSSVTVSSISNASVSSPTVSSISNASVSSVTVSSISNASVSSPTVSSISNASVSSVTVSSISNASVSSVTVSSISNASVSSITVSSISAAST